MSAVREGAAWVGCVLGLAGTAGQTYLGKADLSAATEAHREYREECRGDRKAMREGMERVAEQLAAEREALAHCEAQMGEGARARYPRHWLLADGP